MRFLGRLGTISILIINCMGLKAETISSVIINNCKIDNAYTVNNHREIMEKTWQDVCAALGLPITDVPGGEFCVYPSGNPVYVQSGDLCADGSFKVPKDFGWCNELIAFCPNATWSLSSDKKTCSRSAFSCWINVNEVSEEKLLAGIAYGESSIKNSYEEMAGIASATLRRRDAARQKTVNILAFK